MTGPVGPAAAGGPVRSTADGDDVRIDVRFVVAPAAGRFEPVPAAGITTEGEIVSRGQVVGHVVGPARSEPVVAFCTGFLVRLLAVPGERVRPGQPVAWVHPVEGTATTPGDAA